MTDHNWNPPLSLATLPLRGSGDGVAAAAFWPGRPPSSLLLQGGATVEKAGRRGGGEGWPARVWPARRWRRPAGAGAAGTAMEKAGRGGLSPPPARQGVGEGWPARARARQLTLGWRWWRRAGSGQPPLSRGTSPLQRGVGWRPPTWRGAGEVVVAAVEGGGGGWRQCLVPFFLIV